MDLFGFKKNKCKQDLETALNELPINTKVLQVEDENGNVFYFPFRRIGRFVHLLINGSIPANYNSYTETEAGFLPEEFRPTYEKKIQDYDLAPGKQLFNLYGIEKYLIVSQAGFKCFINSKGKITINVENHSDYPVGIYHEVLYMII